MKVLVTGGAGFLGVHICQQLRALGHQPLSLDLAPPLPDVVWPQIRGSVLNTATLAAAVDGVDAIIHAAALADLWVPRDKPHASVNVEGCKAVTDIAIRARVKLVYVSSYTTLVSGPRHPHRELDESQDIKPDDLLGSYPKSKRIGEQVVARAVLDGLRACTVLPSSPVGPGDRNLTPPTRMIMDFASGNLPAYLDCWMNLVDVRSVAEGTISALERGEPGARYLLSGQDIRLGDVAQMIAVRTGVPAPRHEVPYVLAWLAGAIDTTMADIRQKPPNAPLTGVRLAGRAVSFSNLKARQVLGFEPGSLEEALDASLAWLADEGLIPAPVAG